MGAVGQLLPFLFRPRGRRATRRARCRYATRAHGHIIAASMPQDGAPRRAFLRAHPARAVCSASFCTAFNVCLYSSRVELSAPRADVWRHGSRDDTPRRSRGAPTRDALRAHAGIRQDRAIYWRGARSALSRHALTPAGTRARKNHTRSGAR